MIIENQRCSSCISKEQPCQFLRRLRGASGDKKAETAEALSGVYELLGCPNWEEIMSTYGLSESRPKQGFDDEKLLVHPTERKKKQEVISLDADYVEAFLSRYLLNPEIRIIIDIIVEVRRGYSSNILTKNEQKEFAETIVRLLPGGPYFQSSNVTAVRYYVNCVYHWMHGYTGYQDLTQEHQQVLLNDILGTSAEYDDSWELPGIVKQIL